MIISVVFLLSAQQTIYGFMAALYNLFLSNVSNKDILIKMVRQ